MTFFVCAHCFATALALAPVVAALVLDGAGLAVPPHVTANRVTAPREINLLNERILVLPTKLISCSSSTFCVTTFAYDAPAGTPVREFALMAAITSSVDLTFEKISPTARIDA